MPYRRTLFTCMASLALTLSVAAQGLDEKKAIDTIIGSRVSEEQAKAAADPDKVIAAIEKTSESIKAVRKTSNLDTVDIVFLIDSTVADGGPPAEVEAKIKQHEPEIAELRKEIEGNAMLFHAIDSRAIMVRDVLAVEFGEDTKGVVIYAAAKPGG